MSNDRPVVHYIRYFIVGLLTTGVNFVLFAAAHYGVGLGINTANTMAVTGAVLFAFFANKTWVFKTPYTSFMTVGTELVAFVTYRLVTMALEILGVFWLDRSAVINPLAAKGLIMIIVLISNYLLSRYLIFAEKQ